MTGTRVYWGYGWEYGDLFFLSAHNRIRHTWDEYIPDLITGFRVSL